MTYGSMLQRSAVTDVIQALHQSTVPMRRPLPGPSYALVFPVIAAVLHCPTITPLHDQALAVLSLHVAPEQDIPCGDSLALLYNLLGIIPAYRWDRSQGYALNSQQHQWTLQFIVIQQHPLAALAAPVTACRTVSEQQ